ncbi:MAG: HAMP domain-containing sensor histidine kinase [Patescibacteria group bacterium]
MFRSATVRLTAWYLGLLMALSVGMSLALYAASTNEFDRAIERQYRFWLEPRGLIVQEKEPPNFSLYRLEQLRESTNRLRTGLLQFNVMVFIVGGIACYVLAKRTLDPIARAHEAQREFTANASHELRTPLAAMRAEIEVALRSSDIVFGRPLLQSLLEEVQGLETLTGGLLTLAREEQGILRSSTVNVHAALMRAIRRLPNHQAKRIKVKSSKSQLDVLGDQDRLVELFVVLLDNAVKHSAETAVVQVAVASQYQRVSISIRDTGIGIAKKDIGRIFDRFYRADTSRSKQAAGYGLGLAIAQSIARAHGGEISVESIVGSGTTFTVLLPIQRASASAVSQVA